jgi:hypothetical protein
MKNLIMSALMIAALFTSCSKDESDYEGYGNIAVNVKSDVNISAVQTRTATAVTDDSELAKYKFYVKKGGEDKWNGTYANLKIATFAASSANDYTVSAENCTETEAKTSSNNYGQQRLYGVTSGFSITAGQTTDVSLTLTVANSKVSVILDNSLSTYFDEYAVSIGETGRMLSFPDANTIAYFNAGTELKYSIAATLKSGSKVTFANSVSLSNSDKSATTKAATYYKITIKASSTNGQIGLSLSVDTSMTESTGEVSIDPYNGTAVTDESK